MLVRSHVAKGATEPESLWLNTFHSAYESISIIVIRLLIDVFVCALTPVHNPHIHWLLLLFSLSLYISVFSFGLVQLKLQLQWKWKKKLQLRWQVRRMYWPLHLHLHLHRMLVFSSFNRCLYVHSAQRIVQCLRNSREKRL